jgi:hypothetical protein
MKLQRFRPMLVLLLALSVASISTASLAQNPYTVCIGDRCEHPASINLSCSFATAHPNDIDEQAARLVCMVRNNYEKYTYVRTGMIKGGRCGATYLQVRCH